MASAVDIDPTISELNEGNDDPSSNFWLFFPEGGIALVLAIAAPFWSIKLFFDGKIVAALGLIVITAICGYGFFRAIRARQKILGYLVMLCFLFLAWVVDSSAT